MASSKRVGSGCGYLIPLISNCCCRFTGIVSASAVIRSISIRDARGKM